MGPSKWAGKQLRLINNNDSFFEHNNLRKIFKIKTISSTQKLFHIEFLISKIVILHFKK